jgi:hypothetical protein
LSFVLLAGCRYTSPLAIRPGFISKRPRATKKTLTALADVAAKGGNGQPDICAFKDSGAVRRQIGADLRQNRGLEKNKKPVDMARAVS